jgi:hypothetical protein
MSELDYIGADELVFNNDKENGIHSGGFSVKSIMMKAGMSPIMTINSPNEMTGGSSDKVSDLFNNLVVPNWMLSYNNRIIGGKYKDHHEDDEDTDDEDEDDVIDDDLYDKLLDLVKETKTSELAKASEKESKATEKEMKGGAKKRRFTRKFGKNNVVKKRNTKRNR